MATSKRQRKSPPPRGRGRPSQGIRSGYVRTELYLSPAMRDALNHLADQQQQKTGETTVRADVIREALAEYLRRHLPEAEI